MGHDTPRRFAILGLPRSRTAWLAALLTSETVHCFHDGLAGCGNQEEYYDKLAYCEEKLSVSGALVGDSGPSLLHVQRWLVDRPLIVIDRPQEEAMESFAKAMPDASLQRWGHLVELQRRALDDAAAVLPFAKLDDYGALRDALHMAGLARAVPSSQKFNLFKGLRITERAHAVAVHPIPAPEYLPAQTAMGRFEKAGGDPSGLRVRKYQPDDAVTLNKWMAARSLGVFTDANLPPLGIVIEDAAGPVAALWCYESFGVGVAHLTAPVSRPGLSPKQAWNALGFAVCACIDMAGKWHEPKGAFHLFHCATLKPIARYLSRLGFVESIAPKVSMSLHLS